MATFKTTSRVMHLLFLVGVLTLVLFVSDAVSIAQRHYGGGSYDRGNVRSGANTNVNGGDRSYNQNVNVNKNQNVNVNRNTNINVNHDVDVHSSYYGACCGCCYHSGWGTAAAVATTAVVTAAIVVSRVARLPPACSVVMVNGFTYQQCGTTWYQPEIAGGSTTYVVVNPPR